MSLAGPSIQMTTIFSILVFMRRQGIWSHGKPELWNATRDTFNCLPESGFLRIRGRVENYQNNLQFIIEQCWPAKDGTYEIGDLVPHTEKNIENMCTRIKELLESIQNRHVAAIVQAYLDDRELMDKFCKAPAAMSFHHAVLGGLLEHTLNA